MTSREFERAQLCLRFPCFDNGDVTSPRRQDPSAMSRFAGDPDVMVARAPQHIPHTPYASLNAWVRSDVMVAHAPQHIPHSRNVPRSGHVLCNAAVFACPFVRAVSAIPVACIARMPGSDAVISSAALAVIEPGEPSRRVAVLLSAPRHPAVAVRVAASPSCCPHPTIPPSPLCRRVAVLLSAPPTAAESRRRPCVASLAAGASPQSARRLPRGAGQAAVDKVRRFMDKVQPKPS